MDQPKAEKAIAKEEPFELAASASADELARLKLSEELFELRHQRRHGRSRLQVAMQSLVALVAILGFFANALQTYLNKRAQEKQQQGDQARWSAEFARASRSDKYNAFFATSALVTDETNASKRLVGYAPLKEFVEDSDYNDKATALLEEALTQELRRDTVDHGLADSTQAAVTGILDALSHTSDCRALQEAAKSVDFIGKRKTQSGDVEEAQQVFAVYVRRLLGRAALSCASFDDFALVRRPLREVLFRNPELAGASGALQPPEANALLARVLHATCFDEVASGSSGDCVEVADHYQALCRALASGAPARVGSSDAGQPVRAGLAPTHTSHATFADEQEACDIMARPLPAGAVDAGPADAGAIAASP